MINGANMYHLVLFLKLWVCLENKSWGSLLSLLSFTDSFETLMPLLREIPFSPLRIPVPTLPRAIAKHSTWKPLGCYEASWPYSALALPDLSSLSQLFGGVSALNSPPLYSRMTYLGPVLPPSSYAIKKWQCGAEIPTVSKTEPAVVLVVWQADLLQWLSLPEDAAWLYLECLCSWLVQHRACWS